MRLKADTNAIRNNTDQLPFLKLQRAVCTMLMSLFYKAPGVLLQAGKPGNRRFKNLVPAFLQSGNRWKNNYIRLNTHPLGF